MRRYVFTIVFGTVLFFFGCAPSGHKDTVTQYSTIDALLSGFYDGDISCKELLNYGNFGIGTFNRLEGEMIILDGSVFQVKADGVVYKPAVETKTPFATVCCFHSDQELVFNKRLDFDALQTVIDEAVPNKNIFCAIKITGTFAQMKTRSLPAQKKPYPPLLEVTKNQPEFLMENVKGTLLGFRCPSYVKGINVSGYHLHFISQDLNQGGHVISFELVNGRGEMDVCRTFYLILPENQDAFRCVDLSKNRSKELERVEK